MGLFNSKNDDLINNIKILTEKEFISETEFIERFTDFFREKVPNNIHNPYNIFSKYIKDSSRDYRIKIHLLNLMNNKLEKKLKINDLEINDLNIKLEKAMAMIEMKNNEINKLKNNISKKEYNYINNNKRKKFNELSQKEKNKNRKKRKINRDYNKLTDKLCHNFNKEPNDLEYLYNTVTNNQKN
jgi:hypothetical protein